MKSTLQTVIFALALFTYLGCQKQSRNQHSPENFQTEIISWLNNQKSPNKPNKAANIDLLADNLQFSALTTENLKDGGRLYIVPIGDTYKQVKNVNQGTIATLLVKADATGSIRNGNIILFKPQTSGVTPIPANTFSSIFNGGTSPYDGEFKSLSVTGRKLSTLHFEKNRLVKESRVTAKTSSGRLKCTDWYLEITIYYTDGTTEVIEDYITTTCDGCDGGDLESECPDHEGEGPATAYCEILDPGTDVQVVSETVSETTTNITQLRKYKKPRWKILHSTGWGLYSTESGIVQYSNNVWTWESLEHVGIDFAGMAVGGTVTHTQGTGTPSFVAGTPNVRYAGMSLNFSVTYQAMGNCPGASILLAPRTKNYTANAVWPAQP